MNIYRKEMWIARFFILVLLVSQLAACSGAPAEPAPAAPAEAAPAAVPAAPEPIVEQPTEEPAEPEMILAGEPINSERTLVDSDGSIRANEKRVLSGDAFLDNRYERPFSQTDMIYFPDVDIQTAEIANDSTFFYFTIILRGVDPASGKFTAAYGVEFDRTLTGRGDLLVWASDPQPEWSGENLNVYADKNRDVGGLNPILAEAGFEGDGYETMVALEEDRVAYARINPQEAASIQFAVSRALLDNDEEFLWGAWADKAIKDPSKFDYNDNFGPSEAGSPVKPSADYPLKALHSLDNTCRLPVGVGQTGPIPGMCKIGVPTEEAGSSCVCISRDRNGNCTATSCN